MLDIDTLFLLYNSCNWDKLYDKYVVYHLYDHKQEVYHMGDRIFYMVINLVEILNHIHPSLSNLREIHMIENIILARADVFTHQLP